MTKFVLVTQPRCGTYWLSSMLAGHPDIKFVPDVFDLYRPALPMAEWSAAAALSSLFGLPGGHEAAGTAFHPSVARSDGWTRGLYDLILADPGIKVVRMWRRNMLHMALSLREAEKSGWWRVLPKDREAADKARRPVYLPPRYLLDYVNQWEKERAEFEDKFGGREQLVLWYDEEKAPAPVTAKKVLKFLGLKKADADLSPGYLRQRPNDRVEPRVTNYAEIVKTLKGTKYENWLDSPLPS